MTHTIDEDAPTQNERLVLLARQIYQRKGVIEIDDDALISKPDRPGGCFVQAWVWVADD